MRRPTICPRKRMSLIGATWRASVDGDGRSTKAHPFAPRPYPLWSGDPDADRAVPGLRYRAADVPRLRRAELLGGDGGHAVYRRQLWQDVGRVSLRRLDIYVRAECVKPAPRLPGRLGDDPRLFPDPAAQRDLRGAHCQPAVAAGAVLDLGDLVHGSDYAYQRTRHPCDCARGKLDDGAHDNLRGPVCRAGGSLGGSPPWRLRIDRAESVLRSTYLQPATPDVGGGYRQHFVYR